MQKQFTFRFYDISRDDESIPSAADMLRYIAQEGDKARREQQLAQDYVIRLENLEDDGPDAIVGEFTRCQSTNLPSEVVGSERKTLSATRLGHSVVFRLNHKLGALGIQYDPRIISPSRILEYLAIYNPAARYSIAPRLDAEAWRKFNSGKVRKLQIRVANPADLSLLDGPEKAATECFKNMAEAYDAPTVTIEISMGHRRGFLAEAANALAQKFAGLGVGGPAYVDKMTAKTLVGDEVEDLDLIEERLTVREELSIDDRDPEKNYIVKKTFLSSKMKGLIG